LKDLVLEYLATVGHSSTCRTKRSVLDFIKEISKIKFGTLIQADSKALVTIKIFQKLKRNKRNAST
jgi:hypothetical protein